MNISWRVPETTDPPHNFFPSNQLLKSWKCIFKVQFSLRNIQRAFKNDFFKEKSQFKEFPQVFVEGYQRPPVIGVKCSLTKTPCGNLNLFKIGKYLKGIETKSYFIFIKSRSGKISKFTKYSRTLYFGPDWSSLRPCRGQSDDLIKKG